MAHGVPPFLLVTLLLQLLYIEFEEVGEAERKKDSNRTKPSTSMHWNWTNKPVITVQIGNNNNHHNNN